jgi:hypothetical protein
MVTRNIKIVAQGQADATYASTQKKNPFRLSSAILNGDAYNGETLVRRNIQNDVPRTLAPAPQPGFTTGTLQFIGGATPSYIEVANKAGLQLGSADFTIEWWMYMSIGNPNFPRPFAFSNASDGQIYAVSIEGDDTSGGRTFYIWNSTGYQSFTFPDGLYGSWHHFAIVGTGGTAITVYIDGITNPSRTFTDTYVMSDTNNLSTLNIGSYPEDPAQDSVSFKGIITNFRIVKGHAMYLTNFTPQKSPLDAVSGSTILLLASTPSTAFIDSSQDSTNSVITLKGPVQPVWISQTIA